MDKREKQLIEAFRRVLRFLLDHPLLTPESYAHPKALLEAVIARVTELSAAKVSGTRESQAETARVRTLVRQMRTRLKRIVAIAKAKIHDRPGIEKVHKLPRTGLAPLYQLAQARQMRDAARPYAEEFVKFGCPPDFIDQLTTAIDNLDAALGGRAAQAGTHIGARAALESELRQGRAAVGILDTIVTDVFEKDTFALAAWRAAKRVQALPSAKAEAEPKAEEEAETQNAA